MDEYKIIKYLGKGNFGKVYMVMINKELYALKIFRGDDDTEILKNEINILKYLSEYYININKLVYYDLINKKIVLTYIPGKDLDNVTIFPEDLTDLFRQMATIIYKIHELGVAHNDIKPSNFKYFDNIVYLLDFGLSCSNTHRNDVFKCTSKFSAGTLNYMAPENLVFDNLDHFKSDIFSLGVTFINILTKSIKKYTNYNKYIINKLIDCIELMVTSNSNNRLTLNDIIEKLDILLLI